MVARAWMRDRENVIDDAELIQRTLDGDTRAFDALVQKYQERLYRAMHVIAHHREDAKDAVQEAFLQAFVKLGTFRLHCGFYTWIYRIAVNFVLQTRRRRPAVPLEVVYSAGGHTPRFYALPPEDQVQRDEERGRVKTAIDTLSHEHRTIVELHWFDGQSYETVARHLGIPLGTVRSRLHRAREHVREQLAFHRGKRAAEAFLG
jgi:RNA polymerase sigma-70 factor (ECF subfamily)